jgi:hypothetical protein
MHRSRREFAREVVGLAGWQTSGAAMGRRFLAALSELDETAHEWGTRLSGEIMG